MAPIHRNDGRQGGKTVGHISQCERSHITHRITAPSRGLTFNVGNLTRSSKEGRPPWRKGTRIPGRRAIREIRSGRAEPLPSPVVTGSARLFKVSGGARVFQALRGRRRKPPAVRQSLVTSSDRHHGVAGRRSCPRHADLPFRRRTPALRPSGSLAFRLQARKQDRTPMISRIPCR